MPELNKPDSDSSPSSDSFQNKAEEIAFLRQKITSLAFRGDHLECLKLIEANLKTLYENERWPDVFYSILLTYQRCYPSMSKAEPFEDRMTYLLNKNDIPFVFVNLLKGGDSSIVWSADYFKDVAVLCQGKQDYETALSYCDLCLKLDPANSGAYVIRGWILDDLSRPDEALKMYREALELNDNNHIALNSLAKHLSNKSPEEALEYINRAIELAPTEGTYYDTKAKILVLTGKPEQAIICYDLAISASPYVAQYHYNQAELLLAQNNEIAAAAHYRKAAMLDDRHVPSMWRLAALYKQSDPELALRYIESVAALEPENEEAQMLKGDLLRALGENDAAAHQYKQIIDKTPKNAEALASYASLLLHSDPAGAVNYYSKALALSPKETEYLMGKAKAFENLGDISSAVTQYRSVISVDKSNARAYGRLGTLLAESKPKEAVAFYTKAIEYMPDNSFYYEAKAELLMKLPGGRQEAIACFNNASKCDPTNANLHAGLALLLEESGNIASATEHYKQAVTLDPKDAGSFFHLANILYPTEPEVALIHINSAISLDGENGEYYYLKSKILNAMGHNKNAVEQLEQSLRSGGKNPEMLSELSKLTGADSPKLALSYINHAIEISPNNPEYICLRAQLLLGVGDTDRAKSQFEAALRIEPKNPDAIFGIGCCLAGKNDAAALDYFDKAIAQNGKNLTYYLEKIDLLTRLSSYDKALGACDDAIAVDAESWRPKLQKAKILERTGDATSAVEYYRQALAVFPDCGEAIARLGILLADENPSLSLEYLNRTIKSFPNDYIYHAWMGHVLLSLGRSKESAASYQRAVELGDETPEAYFTLAKILAPSQPETALGYCLRAIDENENDAEAQLLCAKLYLALDQTPAAVEHFKRCAGLNSTCHESREKLADLQYEHADPDVLTTVNEALACNPGCAHCLYLKAKILSESEEPDPDAIINCIDALLKAEPGNIPARRMLIGMLEKKRSYIRLALEKRKLGKLMEKSKQTED